MIRQLFEKKSDTIYDTVWSAPNNTLTHTLTHTHTHTHTHPCAKACARLPVMSAKEQAFEFEINPDLAAQYEQKSEGKTSPQKEDFQDENFQVDDDDNSDEDGDDEDDDIGEEIYSIYDDDEAWPRRLKGEEVDMAEQFFDAVECGECDIVDDLLEQFPQLVNVTRQKQGGDFALYIAAGMGDLEMTETILKPNRSTPVQVHARTVHGHTALSAAALFGHPSVVESLLSCGLDVNSKNVEGLILIDEVLDDIDYSSIGADSEDEDDLELSQSVTTSGGGSDPLLLEKAAILLLRGGATISPSNVYAFHDKFCGAWGDVTDDELQGAIERGCQLATKAELEQERTNEERARTPALVVRRLNQDAAAMTEEGRPSLFKNGKSTKTEDNNGEMDSSGFAEMSPRVSPRKSPRVVPPGRRSSGGRLRQRRYVRSPKVVTSLSSPNGGGISPQKPPSPEKMKSPTWQNGVTVRPRGSPRTPRVIEDLSSLIAEEAANGEKDDSLDFLRKPEVVHSDDSLEVSWSKQVEGPPALPPRPRSHGENAHGNMLEESQPPRVRLPSIEMKK